MTELEELVGEIEEITKEATKDKTASDDEKEDKQLRFNAKFTRLSRLLAKGAKLNHKSLKSLEKSIKKLPKQIKIPEEVEISNLKDFPTEKIVEIKELNELIAWAAKWVKKFKIGESLDAVYKAITKGPLSVKVDNKRPVEVQLVHKKMKYKGSGGGGAVGGGMIPFVRGNGDRASPKVDDVSGVLEAIEFEHHEIHEGGHFFYSNCVVLAADVSQEYMLTVPDDIARKHFTFAVVGSGLITIAFLEGGDRVGTTLQTSYNNDRDSINTPGLIIHKDTSGGTTDGTDIHPDCGGANKQTGVVERNQEIMLKTNTKYILKVTSGANNNNIGVHFDWYEHTDTY